MRPTITSEEQKRLVALLADAREKAGLKQVDVAERIEEPQSFVAKYESGQRRIDVIEFIRICRAIGTDPVRLFSKIAKSVR